MRTDELEYGGGSAAAAPDDDPIIGKIGCLHSTGPSCEGDRENLYSMTDLQPLPRTFYLRHPCLVAPELLNKLLVREDGRMGRIVEVEAYAGDQDPAAHSHRGPTKRNATMFGIGGHLYVYLNYGIHWCANAVCGPAGQGHGVLLRAIEPMAGVALMRQARGAATKDRDLGSGPGRLGQALGITKAQDGADLVTGDQGVWIVSDGTPPPAEPAVTARIGISKAIDLPWRWHVPNNPHVSPGRPLNPTTTC